MKCAQIAKWIVAILLVPLCINFVCVLKGPYTIVGDGTDWLGFFGSYIGGAITVLMTMWVIRTEKTKEIARKRYENQKEYYDRLCRDMGELCGIIDLDKFSFLIQRLHIVPLSKLTDSYIKDLSEIDNEVKSMLNTFILRYGYTTCQEQLSFLSCCYEFSEKMRNEITCIQNLLVKFQQADNSGDFKSKVMDVVKRLDVLLRQEQPISFAKKWREIEYSKLNDLKTKYENC